MSRVDWARVGADLDADGVAVVKGVLAQKSCEEMRERYADAQQFRSRVVMQRHGFGRGEYQYFAYPLPPLVQKLRETFYPPLAGVANRWMQAMRLEKRYPDTHAEYRAACHAAGQLRPTPLLLRYGAGDYNCLHQDLYGALSFPLQMVVLLSDPACDYEGGELVLVEQRPRMQSRPLVVPLQQGDAAIFAVNERPVQGLRGAYRVKQKHGVSRITRGERHTMGVIFHDAS